MPADPGPPAEEEDEQLADLLEECLRAEHAQPGSSRVIIQAAPAYLQSRLEQLLAVGQALRRTVLATDTGILADLRARIMRQIRPTPPR
jgi:hypothetical protein